jgi:hypothetical protein
MSISALRPSLLTIVALAAGACDRLPHRAAGNSITVRLPPARTAAPGFKTVADKRDAL